MLHRRRPAAALRRLVEGALAFALGLALTGVAFAQNITPEVTFLHRNATGDVVARTDASGAVVWRADVLPFSRLILDPANVEAPARYLGQNREQEIGPEGGLYRLGARMYAPFSGSFISPDPLSLAQIDLADPQRFNKYSYGLNNPYRYADPSGLDPADRTILADHKLTHYKFLAFLGIPLLDRAGIHMLVKTPAVIWLGSKRGVPGPLGYFYKVARYGLVAAGPVSPVAYQVLGALAAFEVGVGVGGAYNRLLSHSLGDPSLSPGEILYDMFNPGSRTGTPLDNDAIDEAIRKHQCIFNPVMCQRPGKSKAKVKTSGTAADHDELKEAESD